MHVVMFLPDMTRGGSLGVNTSLAEEVALVQGSSSELCRVGHRGVGH